MKKFLLIFSIITISVISIMTVFDVIVMNINYSYNMQIWEEKNYSGVIYKQSDFPDIKFGVGNVAKNGCGAVSIYNILALDNKPEKLPDIIKKLDVFGETAFGLLGAKPFSVINILKQYGYKVKYSFNTNDFDSLAQNSRYAIYLYIGQTKDVVTGHYQLLTDYNKETQQYQLYSPYYQSTMSNLLEYTEGCFIKVLITVN